MKDIFEYQIQGTFEDMEEIILCSEFVHLPWSLDDFLDRNYKSVREGATVRISLEGIKLNIYSTRHNLNFQFSIGATYQKHGSQRPS